MTRRGRPGRRRGGGHKKSALPRARKSCHIRLHLPKKRCIINEGINNAAIARCYQHRDDPTGCNTTPQVARPRRPFIIAVSFASHKRHLLCEAVNLQGIWWSSHCIVYISPFDMSALRGV